MPKGLPLHILEDAPRREDLRNRHGLSFRTWKQFEQTASKRPSEKRYLIVPWGLRSSVNDAEDAARGAA